MHCKRWDAQRFEDELEWLSNHIVMWNITPFVTCPGNKKNKRYTIDSCQARKCVNRIANAGAFHEDEWHFTRQICAYRECDGIILPCSRYISPVQFEELQFSNKLAER